MKKKPKGKTPSLIGLANGRPERATVLRKSNCSRCDGEILTDSVCFNIPKAGNGFNQNRRYCKDCYEKILEQTQNDLNELRTL